VREGTQAGGGEREKQASRRVESPIRGSIPGTRDHDQSQRQTLNQLSHPGAPKNPLLCGDPCLWHQYHNYALTSFIEPVTSGLQGNPVSLLLTESSPPLATKLSSHISKKQEFTSLKASNLDFGQISSVFFIETNSILL